MNKALAQDEHLKTRTRESFGYQWTVFGEMKDEFEEDFLNYVHPISREFFSGKRGLDAGCGFGRHLYYAARFGAKMVGLDFSRAIVRSRDNTREIKDVGLIQGDLLRPPLRPASFDFVYSIGVLHHLPDPEAGFQALLPLVRPGGSIFIWVYSKSRAVSNTILEGVRTVTSRLPLTLTRALSFVGALVDWIAFIQPYRWCRQLVGPRVDALMFPESESMLDIPSRSFMQTGLTAFLLRSVTTTTIKTWQVGRPARVS